MARRSMEYAALNYPAEIFKMAKADYFKKLNAYHETSADQEQSKQFIISERERATQLSLFNDSGSVDVDQGNNETVRPGSTSSRAKHSAI